MSLHRHQGARAGRGEGLLLIIPVATLVAGCGGHGHAPAGAAERAPAEPVPEVELETLAGGPSNAGTYYLAWRSEPETIPVAEPFELSVWVLEGPGGAAVEDATLAVSARAIQHAKWMDAEAVVTPAGAGRFDVEGLVFQLPGLWELYFDVTREGITERAQDRLSVQEPSRGAESP